MRLPRLKRNHPISSELNSSVKASAELKSQGRVISTDPKELESVLDQLVKVDTVTISLSLNRKLSNGNSNNYFHSIGLSVSDAYEANLEGVPEEVRRKTLGIVIKKRIANMFSFIRTVIKEQQEIDGIPVYNLGGGIDAR